MLMHQFGVMNVGKMLLVGIAIGVLNQEQQVCVKWV